MIHQTELKHRVILLALIGQVILLWASVLLAAGPINNTSVKSSPSLKSGLKVRIDQSIQYLKDQQKDGRWLDHPGITALCLQGFFTSHRKYNRKDGPFMRKPIEYLLALQQKDGSIYDPDSRRPTKNYCTSLAVLALAQANDPTFDKAIERGSDYLIRTQADEGEDYDPEKDYFYGGIGYGGDLRPDLSNLQLSLDALHAAGVDKNHPVYKRALIFISRCQDSESNDQQWASGKTGGFVYSPDAQSNANLPSKKEDGNVMTPYGSMTFAGIKSLIFCNVDKDDPRVLEAMRWVMKNFSVEHHPGMGQVSVYYYYYTLAKTLSVLDIETLELADGSEVDWRVSLASELMSRQNKDGSWINPQKKFMEGNPVLATAYALNTLNIIYRSFL